MVESFPSKEKGTTTKHAKTFRVRLLSSVDLEFEKMMVLYLFRVGMFPLKSNKHS